MADEPKKSIKEQIQEKLGQGQSVGAADIADFSPKEEKKPETEEQVKLENSSEDKILEAAASDQPFQAMADEQKKAEDFGGYKLGLMDMEESVDITEYDKNEFMDCLVDDKRFTRYFELLGGKIKGKFRSRTTEESMAILSELSRRQRLSGVIVSLEHSAFLRHASLAFQVAELQNVEYNIPDGPLKAQYDADNDEVIDPAWLKLVDKYSKMEEGLEQAIYSKLMEFERVYWTLVKNAANQDFWNPEDSSTD